MDLITLRSCSGFYWRVVKVYKRYCILTARLTAHPALHSCPVPPVLRHTSAHLPADLLSFILAGFAGALGTEGFPLGFDIIFNPVLGFGLVLVPPGWVGTGVKEWLSMIHQGLLNIEMNQVQSRGLVWFGWASQYSLDRFDPLPQVADVFKRVII